MGCESKLDESIGNAEVFPMGYQTDVIPKNRKKHGGGVFLAFKDGYVTSCIEGSDSNSEAAWAEVAISKQQPLYLCSFYRPPGIGDQGYVQVSQMLANIS